ncbi:hypothetical protein FHS57_005095 [Runella defluvii]|uniref:Uncharacterized protein n=1 Tax=Runella defluvii TaxID=370973 RepID=A0A7W5ZQ85_9BACT|nr:hypothetical protein [Runella defluvii]MBB3841074.1 hypothetical protein [Runella defluvii]
MHKLLVLVLGIFLISCDSKELTDEQLKRLIYSKLHSEKVVPNTTKDSLFDFIYRFDFDHDRDSTEIGVYREIEDNKHLTVLDLFTYVDGDLKRILSDTVSSERYFHRISAIQQENQNFVIIWENPYGGSSGNKPLWFRRYFEYKKDLMTELPISNDIKEIQGGSFWHDLKPTMIVRNEDIGQSYELILSNDLLNIKPIQHGSPNKAMIECLEDSLGQVEKLLYTNPKLKQVKSLKFANFLYNKSIIGDTIKMKMNERIIICGCSDFKLFQWEINGKLPVADDSTFKNRFLTAKRTGISKIYLDKYSNEGVYLKVTN